MSAIVNDRDLLLQGAVTRLLPAILPDSLYLNVVRGLLLTSPGFNFQVDDAGNAAPVNFLITATLKQVSGTVGFSVVSGAATLTGSGNTRTLAFSDVTSFPVTIRGTVVDSDGTTFTNEITFTKVTSAAASTSYWLTRSAGAITRNTDGSFTPNSISFTGIAATGGSAPGAYAGRFVIATTTDGTTYTTQYTSAVDENTKAYTGWPAGTVAIRTQLYQAGGTTNLLDEEIVPIVVSGTHGITVAMSNDATTVPALSTGVVSSFTGSGTQLQVFEGSTLLTYTTGTLAAGQFAIGTPVVSPAGKLTVGAISGNGTTTATVADHTAMDSATSSVTITYPITLKRADGTTITTSAVQTVTKAIGGATGTTGTTGARGSQTVYASTKYGMTQTAGNLATWAATDADPYTGTGTVGGIDQYANRAIYNAINNITGNVQLNSTTHLVIGDTVTIMNATTVAGASTAVTKYWSGTGWVKPGLVIDGNLLVTGTLSATKINGGTLGAVDLAITGSTRLNGTYTVGSNDTALVVNDVGGNIDGIYAYASSNGTAIRAENVSTGVNAGFAVVANSGSDGVGVYGATSGTGFGVWGSNSNTSGYAVFGSGYVGGNSDAIFAGKVKAGGTPNNDAAIIGRGTGALHGGRFHHSTLGNAGFCASGTSGLAFDFYADGSGTNYGPFTGAHDALIPKGASAPGTGDIAVDMECLRRANVSNTIFEAAPSGTPYQKNVLGVVVQPPSAFTTDFAPAALKAWVEIDGAMEQMVTAEAVRLAGTHDYMMVNAVGEGQINVCGEGGDIEAGDYIVTSSTPGKGMKQTPFVMTLPDGSTMQVQVLCNFTVAKAREAATFSSPGEVKTIACSYHSC